MQINIKDELATFIKAEATRKGKSVAEVAEQMLSLGRYQLEYRAKQNTKRAEEMKTFRQLRNRAASDPELAAVLGLGSRVAVK